jgi:hypothetical protein
MAAQRADEIGFMSGVSQRMKSDYSEENRKSVPNPPSDRR